MSLGADSLPGWVGKPRPDTEESKLEQSDTDTGATTTTGGDSDNEPVVVWEAGNRLEAQIVQGRLASQGIPAFLSGEALGPIYGLTTGSLAATLVLVPAPLAQKALDILQNNADWDEADWESTEWEDASNESDEVSSLHEDSDTPGRTDES
jgi:hypothetical protein